MEQLGFDLGYEFDEPTTSKGGGMRIVQADFVSAKHKTFEEIFYNGKYNLIIEARKLTERNTNYATRPLRFPHIYTTAGSS